MERTPKAFVKRILELQTTLSRTNSETGVEGKGVLEEGHKAATSN